jgi:ATP-dependent Clp protease ATP-binding subunit ClpA
MATPDSPADDVFLPGGRLRFELLTEPAGQAMREAIRLARATRWDSVRSPHIFMGLLAVPDAGIRNWVERLSMQPAELLTHFQELFHQDEGEADPVLALNREFLSDNVLRILREAYQRASDHQRGTVSPMDLLISLLTAPNSIVADCFERSMQGVSAAKLTELAVLAEQHVRQA